MSSIASTPITDAVQLHCFIWCSSYPPPVPNPTLFFQATQFFRKVAPPRSSAQTPMCAQLTCEAVSPQKPFEHAADCRCAGKGFYNSFLYIEKTLTRSIWMHRSVCLIYLLLKRLT